MTMMLEQTLDAYRTMRAAGFKRGEFHAEAMRTRKTVDGRRITEYGPAIIWAKNDELVGRRLDAMRAQGLSVTFLAFDGTCKAALIRNDGRGACTIENYVEGQPYQIYHC